MKNYTEELVDPSTHETIWTLMTILTQTYQPTAMESSTQVLHIQSLVSDHLFTFYFAQKHLQNAPD